MLTSAIAAAATALLVAALTAIPHQVLDVPALGDSMRNGQDVQVTAEIVNDDGLFHMAFPGRFDLPPNSPLRRKLDVESALTLMHEVRGRGGIDVGRLMVRLILQGRRNQQIQITGLTVAAQDVGTAARGTLLALNEEGASLSTLVSFDLSEALPQAREALATGKSRNFFEANTISLRDGEQAVLLCRFNAKGGYTTEFRLRLRYTIGRQTRNILVDDKGKPFTVTSVSCHEPGSYVYYDHAYTMQPRYGELALLLAPDPHHVVAGFTCPAT